MFILVIMCKVPVTNGCKGIGFDIYHIKFDNFVISGKYMIVVSHGVAMA